MSPRSQKLEGYPHQAKVLAITGEADKFHRLLVGWDTPVSGERGDIRVVEFTPRHMLYQAEFFSDSVSEILGSIGATGVLRLSDYGQLMAAILSDSLDETEKKSVDRMLRFVRRGRIQIEDDISKWWLVNCQWLYQA